MYVPKNYKILKLISTAIIFLSISSISISMITWGHIYCLYMSPTLCCDIHYPRFMSLSKSLPLICTSPFSFSLLHTRNPLLHQIITHILLPLFLCTPTVLFWPGVHYSRFWRKVFIIHGVHKGGYYGKVFNVHIPTLK